MKRPDRLPADLSESIDPERGKNETAAHEEDHGLADENQLLVEGHVLEAPIGIRRRDKWFAHDGLAYVVMSVSIAREPYVRLAERGRGRKGFPLAVVKKS